jgi:hypothetical protein
MKVGRQVGDKSVTVYCDRLIAYLDYLIFECYFFTPFYTTIILPENFIKFQI